MLSTPAVGMTDADMHAGLLLDTAAGDRGAFERLYRATSPRLFSVCLRLLSDRAEAEDVLQEVYTAIWHKADQYDPDRAGAMAWMAMIARNRCIDRLRAPGHSARTTAIELGDELPDGGATPIDEAEAQTDRERLQRCMQRLDDRRRGLIRTAFFEGATYEELARRSGAPLGSVKSWIRRGLMQLRTCLET
jgi:RNA polymerase sigma-70 factor (ECF subfamily)